MTRGTGFPSVAPAAASAFIWIVAVEAPHCAGAPAVIYFSCLYIIFDDNQPRPADAHPGHDARTSGTFRRGEWARTSSLFHRKRFRGSQFMYRVVLCVAAAILTFGMAATPAAADDRETCFRAVFTDEDEKETIPACSRLIQQNPKEVKAYRIRGGAYQREGDYDRAIADYSQAIGSIRKMAATT
jgi:tetratricopeptide (TPR) repeat protein